MDRTKEFTHLVHILDPDSIFPPGASDIPPTNIGLAIGSPSEGKYLFLIDAETKTMCLDRQTIL